jgi:pyruvate dehydrogenase E2 component (dihydrolipoamide acetyltransferase)
MILGTINKKPVVVNDKIVIRKIMAISATLDHRVVDGSHGGRMFRVIKHLIKNPELLDAAPE